jgi:very-short-patch-repair endonuclease
MGRPHTPESRAKLSAAKKGKPLSAEHRAAISAGSKGKAKSPEHRSKIGAAHKGRINGPHTEEHKAKIKASSIAYGPRPHTPEHIEKIAAAKRGKPNLIKDKEAWKAKNRAAKLGKKRPPFSDAWKAKLSKTLTNRKGPSSLERMVGEVLTELKISHVPQAPLGWYHVDFLLPDYSIVMECDGIYWHSQPKQIAADKQRDAWLTRQGYLVIRLTESDIRHDVRAIVVQSLVSYYRL